MVNTKELYQAVNKLYKARLFDGTTKMELNKRIEELANHSPQETTINAVENKEDTPKDICDMDGGVWGKAEDTQKGCEYCDGRGYFYRSQSYPCPKCSGAK